MRHLLYFCLLLTCLSIISCDHSCSDNRHNSLSDSISSDSTNITSSSDSDSIGNADSLGVGIYEVVEDNDTINSTLSQYSSSTHINNRRGESTAQKMNDKFSAQSNGIGVVRIGTNIKDLPSSSKGLYDKIKKEGGEYLFYNGKSQILEVSCDKHSQKITSIRVTSASISTEDGINQFMKYSALQKNAKVKQALKHARSGSFTIDGITYELDEDFDGEKYVSAIIIR